MAIVRLRPEELKRAIASNSLSLQFQPQVQVSTGKLVGAEAFVRWPHPAHGMIGPSDIIPLVEIGRFHVEFDRWVIAAVCDQIRKWDADRFEVPVVAANLWVHTLSSGKAVDMLRERILAAGVAPKVIEVEFPRGTIAEPTLLEAARRLRVLGVRTASEEFGDPAIAKRAIDFDTLKIGYPAARDVAAGNALARERVTAIVAAARAANARVVADSVETSEQERALESFGCEIVQGYLYGPEVSAGELRQLATAGARRVAAGE